MNKSEAPKTGKGLTPLGWAKVVAAGVVLVGGPLYKGTEYVLDHARSAPERISRDTAPGVILTIDPVAQEEGSAAMVDVTVAYEGIDQKLRMPAAEAAAFSENQEVEVSFSVRPGRTEGEIEVHIESIIPAGTDPA